MRVQLRGPPLVSFFFFTLRRLVLSAEIDDGVNQKSNTSQEQQDQKSDQLRPTGRRGAAP
jgi:hypothetical protein